MNPFYAEIEPRWKSLPAHSPVHLCLTCMDITEGTAWFCLWGSSRGSNSAGDVQHVRTSIDNGSKSHFTEWYWLKGSCQQGWSLDTWLSLHNLFSSYIQAIFLSSYSQFPTAHALAVLTLEKVSAKMWENCCNSHTYTLTFQKETKIIMEGVLFVYLFHWVYCCLSQQSTHFYICIIIFWAKTARQQPTVRKLHVFMGRLR